MKKLSLVLSLMLFTLGMAMAQRAVSGKVTDETGESLVGASILVKGTTVGTITDIDGNFNIKVPENAATLVCSYTGFTTQELALGAGNVVNITLKEGTTLSEVVVTAIGIKKDKKALGYAVSDLNGDQLQQRSEGDPVRALAGKTPGVVINGGGGSPGMSTRINIRGFSSLTGNTQPLFVVDGVPFDISTNASTGPNGGTQFSSRSFDIDPNNIESMNILKGAAASALYGSRAANGVVVITTKAGKKARKGLEITYNSSISWEEISGIPTYQSKYGQGSNQLYNGAFIGNWGAPFPEYVADLNKQYGTNYTNVYGADPDGEPWPAGQVPHPLGSNGFAINTNKFYKDIPGLVQTDADGNIKYFSNGTTPVPTYVDYKSFDFLKDFFNTGILRENSLSINAGTDNASLTAVVSRMDNKGYVPNAGTDRTSFSFGGNGKLANGLVVSGNVTYVNTNQFNPPIAGSFFQDYGSAVSAGTIFGRLFYLPRNYNLNAYPFENPVDGSNVFYRALDNPYWAAKYNKYRSAVNRVFGNMALSYDLTSWLNFTVKGGVNTYNDFRTNYTSPGGVAQAFGSIWNDDIKNTEIDMSYLATFKHDFNQDWGFQFITGINTNRRNKRETFTYGDRIITKGIENVNNTATQTVYGGVSNRAFWAALADAQISYKNYWYIGLVGRNDHASTLPTANNSFWYGGVNTSFIISDALNIKSKVLDYAKIRAAWTQVGNEASPYQTVTTYNVGTPFTAADGSSINQASLGDVLGNASLRNELTKELEFGADLRFFGNRIGLDATWYKRNSFDQITSAAVPASSGYRSAIINAGEIQNSGFEIGLDLTPFRSNNGFTWNTYINFANNKSLIVDPGEGGDIIYGGGIRNIHREGLPYGQLYGTAWARSEGKLLIDKNTGFAIIDDESKVIGDPNPDFVMGVNNTLSWKGLSLNALFDWRQGGDMYSVTTGSLILRGQLAITEDREALRVIPGVYGDLSSQEAILVDGKEQVNTVPITSFDYFFTNFSPYGADESNVYDATIIRLREIGLSYNLPKAFVKRSKIFGSARISVTGRNLWFYTPNFAEGINLDPEVLGEVADTNIQGVEFGSAPTTRRYGINLQVTF